MPTRAIQRMKLVTDDSTLWYFPPDDDDDIPRYAIQSSKQPLYEKFIPMIIDDDLTIVPKDDQLSINLLQYQIGMIDKKDKAHLDDFLKEWEKGLTFLRKKESGDFDVDEDEIGEEHSLKSHLKDHKDGFLEDRDIKLRFLTWNLHGAPLYNTDEDLSQLFCKGDEGTEEKFELYFIAFQEIVPLSAKNLRSSPVPIEHWIKKILGILGDDYKVLQTNKLLGLASILIIKDELSLNFHDLEIGSIGTGILNFYGNKGAIATCFKIQDFKFAFLNCHFAAGESENFLLKRRKELQGVKTYIKLPHSNGSLVSNDKSILFDVDDVDTMLKSVDLESDEESEVEEQSKANEDDEDPLKDAAEKEQIIHEVDDQRKQIIESTTPEGEEHDGDKNIIFIGGDLNYRITASHEIINALVKEKDFKSLLDYDTLTKEKDQGRILDRFQEGTINFPPTYKINEENGDYVDDRKPSYTDRIFVSESKYTQIESYESPNITLSDHRPVFSDYSLKLPIINNHKRNDIVKTYLKEIDDQENNSKKTTFKFENLENEVKTPILTSTTIEVKITNTGDYKSYWEIIDSVENADQKFPGKHVSGRVEPVKGVIPKTGTQVLKITATLPIGCKKYERTLILRAYNSQDYFITCTFVAKNSYFGSSIDELNGVGDHTGIPKPLYTLINYLTNNIVVDMFDETKLNFTHDLEKKIIKAIDQDEELNPKDLEKADMTIDGSSSRAVSRVLLLLLRNLDGGIVSSDLSTFLLSSYKNDQDVLEKILESLPALRANVLIYLSSFLRLCIESGIAKDEIFRKFEGILLEVPKQRKRDFVLGRTNYEKLRREFLQKLLG